MSISSKVVCLVISVFVKERRKLPCEKSLFRVQTLTSRFGKTTVLIYAVLDFYFTCIDMKTLFIPSRRCIYHCKQGHLMPIDFNMISYLLGVYMGQM